MNAQEPPAPTNQERLQHLDHFVAGELDYLGHRAKFLERRATYCYLCCASILFIAVGFALFRAVMTSLNSSKVPWLAPWLTNAVGSLDVVRNIASSLIVIGLLVSMARFAFVMGKSFMVESIRNNNRRHAIAFGKFYLRAFHDQVTWADAKDAFRTWNIDIGSWFPKQNADDIDPQLLEHFEAIFTALGNKAREDK